MYGRRKRKRRRKGRDVWGIGNSLVWVYGRKGRREVIEGGLGKVFGESFGEIRRG